MLIFKSYAVAGLMAAAISLPFAAWGQDHHHAGDIAVSEVGGQLVVGGDGVLIAADGYKLYEAEFGDQFIYYQTKNPGFQTQGGATLKPNALISFEALGSLSYWDGASWSAAANGDYVGMADALGEVTRWTGSGVTPGASSYVAQVSRTGGIHEHLPFTTNPTGTEGAYLIQLRLTSDDYQTSDPFYMVFNYGLGHEDFELAVDSLITAVPEPSTYAMMLMGVAGIAGLKRRRRNNH